MGLIRLEKQFRSHAARVFVNALTIKRKNGRVDYEKRNV